MKDFDTWYFVGDKCDTRFDHRKGFINSYYKCEETWDHQQKEIEKLKEQLEEVEKIIKEIKGSADDVYIGEVSRGTFYSRTSNTCREYFKAKESK